MTLLYYKSLTYCPDNFKGSPNIAAFQSRNKKPVPSVNFMSSGSEHVVHAAKAPATIYKDHILLPANAGDTRAHILEYPHMKEDLAWRDSKNLWDYVATTFDLIEERPKTLYNFFNPAVKSFKFSTDQMHEGTLATLMIWRVGDDVLVGYEQYLRCGLAND
jgi:hypothetical protein